MNDVWFEIPLRGALCRRRSALIVGALLGSLAACGGGGDDTDTATTTAERTTASPSSVTPAPKAALPGAFQITSVTPGSGQVGLAWSASASATSYSVSHGSKPGVYAADKLQSAGPSATVPALNNGFKTYLMVTAINAGGSRNAAKEASAMPMYAPTLKYGCSRNLYVSTTGKDSNSGTSTTQAYATLDAAASRADLQAGDCINVLPGTYQQTVSLNRGGVNTSATGYVVLRSSVPQGAKIIGPAGSYSAINLNASYLIVDGFDVQGADGAAIDGCGDSTQGKHHQAVLNNLAHDSGGGGIAMCWGDYFRIEGNVTRNNAATNGYQASGISIYQARAVSDHASGFHHVVRNNVSYANLIRFACDHCHTDGNGIIIDDFQNTQEDSAPWKQVVFPFATLVENNLVFGNGGKGIQVYVSDHVTVRNNTAYFNNTDTNFDGTWRAELSNSFSANNLWIDNIAVTNPAIDPLNMAYQNVAGDGYTNPGVQWKNNLASDGGKGSNLVRVDNASGTLTAAQGNMLGVSPKFVAASSDPTLADFRLQSGSPAAQAGVATGNPDNLNGVPRPTSGKVALGAY